MIVASSFLTIISSPNCAIRFLPSAVQGAGVGSSLLKTYLQTMNPDNPFSG